jgi:hypothetical protein
MLMVFVQLGQKGKKLMPPHSISSCGPQVTFIILEVIQGRMRDVRESREQLESLYKSVQCQAETGKKK